MCANCVPVSSRGYPTARKAGQLISRGPPTWLVRVSLGRGPETTSCLPLNETAADPEPRTTASVTNGYSARAASMRPGAVTVWMCLVGGTDSDRQGWRKIGGNDGSAVSSDFLLGAFRDTEGTLLSRFRRCSAPVQCANSCRAVLVIVRHTCEALTGRHLSMVCAGAVIGSAG